jgi:hypothetical protein
MTPSNFDRMSTRPRGLRPSAALTLSLALVLATLLHPATSGAETYGDGVHVAAATPIAAILADPDAYVGKTVRVEGRVAEVCPKAGCWMELASGDAGETLRIKVEDGVIVFPADAAGRAAVAEGVVEAVPMSREQYVGWLRHLAEERGDAFDESGVGDGPFRLIQVRGTGAEIAAAESAG